MKRLPVLVAAAAVVAISVGVVTAHAVTSKNSVAVRLNEFNLIPAVQGARAGKVTFVVSNKGKIEHEFVVIKSAKPAGNLLGGDHGPNRADESGAVGEIESLKPGEQKKVTLKLKKGHYSLVCNLPVHYKAGQFMDFYVR